MSEFMDVTSKINGQGGQTRASILYLENQSTGKESHKTLRIYFSYFTTPFLTFITLCFITLYINHIDYLESNVICVLVQVGSTDKDSVAPGSVLFL